MTGEYERIEGLPAEFTLDARPGPASHLTQAKADAMIENALLAAGFGAAPEAPVSEPPVSEPPRVVARRPHRMAFWQAAAAVLIACLGLGSASAAVMWFAKRREASVEPLPLKPAARQVQQPSKAVPVEVPAVTPEPVELEEVEQNAPAGEKARTRKPEDWLEDANRLRAQRRWQEADESYARVWQAAPKSDAAYVARVASAGVRLDHLRDPRAALARYRSALKVQPSGPLSEEARYGIAEAHRSLGDTKAELSALRDFLTRHPHAGLTNRARRRMLELEAKP